MKRQTVQSSNLRTVGYDSTSKTLEIEFHEGRIYQYSNVPFEIFTGLMNAPSKGKFHHRCIKYNFLYTRVQYFSNF